MIVIGFVLILIGVIITAITCVETFDSSIKAILTYLIILSCLIFGSCIISYQHSYRLGQIDAIKGDIKYELKVEQDSTWVER